jgi:hypothetical protein
MENSVVESAQAAGVSTNNHENIDNALSNTASALFADGSIQADVRMRKELQASTPRTATTKNGLSITATREGRLPNDKRFHINELNRNAKRQSPPANGNQ